MISNFNEEAQEILNKAKLEEIEETEESEEE